MRADFLRQIFYAKIPILRQKAFLYQKAVLHQFFFVKNFFLKIDVKIWTQNNVHLLNKFYLRKKTFEVLA